jgi:hypothetical protein
LLLRLVVVVDVELLVVVEVFVELLVVVEVVTLTWRDPSAGCVRTGKGSISLCLPSGVCVEFHMYLAMLRSSS